MDALDCSITTRVYSCCLILDLCGLFSFPFKKRLHEKREKNGNVD